MKSCQCWGNLSHQAGMPYSIWTSISSFNAAASFGAEHFEGRVRLSKRFLGLLEPGRDAVGFDRRPDDVVEDADEAG